MRGTVAVAKEADKEKEFSHSRSVNSIRRIRNEPEMQLSSLGGVIGNIRSNGGMPSVESIAMQMSGMPTGERAPALLALQQTHGNRYVQRVVAGIQAKLVVGQPGDKYEQEADRVAEEVMLGHSLTHAKKSAVSPVRLQVPDGAPVRNDVGVPSAIDRTLSSPGQSLDESMRHFMEQHLQHDFSRVRIHTDSRASESAHAMKASAYTVGTDVVFASGRYAPHSEEGLALLAHELVHVKQQTHVGDGVRSQARLQREVGAISQTPTCTDAPRPVARSLVGQGTEARGRTFAARLTPDENSAWDALSVECKRDPAQCPRPHSHAPRPRTAWSLSTLHGRIHAGMDVQAPRMTPVYAPIRGEVLQAQTTRGLYGNVVMLLHECPPPTSEFGIRPVTTIFAHMDSISVSSGTVQAGAQVGTVGDTGVPGRVHLHFSVQYVPQHGGPPRRASSGHEERPRIRIRPDDWLRALGIPIAPAVTVQPAETVEPAVTQPEQESPPVLQRHLDSRRIPGLSSARG